MQKTNVPLLVFTRQNKQFEFDKRLAANFLKSWRGRPESSPAVLALRRHFSRRADVFYTKDRNQMDEMWATGDVDKRRELLKRRRFLAMLDEAQARDIILAQDMELIGSLKDAMRRGSLGVLPSSPRLSTQMRIQLMKTAIIAEEPEKLLDKELEDVLRKRIRIDAALALSTADFPRECDSRDYRYCSISPQYVDSPALTLAHAPLESGLCLLMTEYVWKQQAVLDTYELQLRHGIWEKLVMKIGSEETPFGFRDILLLCDYGDLENADPELVSAIFETGHPLVQSKLIYTGLLTTSQMDRAWQEGDAYLCRNLLAEPDFLYQLTDSQAQDIMAVNDVRMLQTLAVNIKLIYKIGKNSSASRMTPEIQKELLRFIANHPDKDVQRLLECQNCLQGRPIE